MDGNNSKRYPFPMIDLHLHLDGAIAPKTLLELGRERKIPLPADSAEGLTPYVVAENNTRDVNEYLKKFELPAEILQDGEALTRVAKELTERLDGEGIAYAEIRFAPQLHTRKGLSQRDAVRAVAAGIRDGRKNRAIKIGLILSAMSLGKAGINRAENLLTAETAAGMLGEEVAAIDLAGAEGFSPLSDFGYLFAEAKRRGIPATCHAGDSQGPETVRTVIEEFRLCRIGHGHRIFDDKRLLQKGIDEGVTLEICLTSNIQCRTQPSYREHPAKAMLDMGMRVTLNTDNPVIAGVTLQSEYDAALKKAGFTEKDLIKMNIYAAEAAFLPQGEKDELIRQLRRYL